MASMHAEVLQADKMTGAPAASAAAAAAGKKEEEGKEGEGKESDKAQPKGGAWWQWLLVRIHLSSLIQQCLRTPSSCDTLSASLPGKRH